MITHTPPLAGYLLIKTLVTRQQPTTYDVMYICAGVYLSLKGVVYPNNSVILITEIGKTSDTPNNGLQCITDRSPCCTSPRAGEWFFPDDGGMVPIEGMATTFYRNRGNDGEVNLNRLNNDVMMPTGTFCCVVRDTNDANQRVCANIGK